MDANATFTIPIRGQEIPVTHTVTVSSDRATNSFRAEVGGKSISDVTLSGLREKLMVEVKKQAVSVAIPFEMIRIMRGRIEASRGVLTGIHAGSRKILVRWDGGGADQLDGYGRDVLEPLSNGERDELVGLYVTRANAQQRIDEIEKAKHFDARKAIEDAIAESLK